MRPVTLILDSIAAVLMIGLLIFSNKDPDTDDYVNRNFNKLSLVVITMSMIDAFIAVADIYIGGFDISQIRMMQPGEASELIMYAVISFSNVFMTTVFLFIWITFLAWRLYHDRGIHKRNIWFNAIPLFVSASVFVIGCIFFLISDKAKVFLGISFLMFYAIRGVYLVATWRLLKNYKAQEGYLRFFNVVHFLLPVIIGWLVQDFTPLNLRALGSAIGTAVLYRSVWIERRYIDKESGFYNRSYIEYLRFLIRSMRFSPGGALVFDLDNMEDAKIFYDVLKKALPDDCDPLRLDDSRVVVLTKIRDRGPLYMVLQDVKEALEIDGKCILMKKDETSEEFLERVLA